MNQFAERDPEREERGMGPRVRDIDLHHRSRKIGLVLFPDRGGEDNQPRQPDHHEDHHTEYEALARIPVHL